MATTNVKAYAAGAPDAPLAEMNIERRDVLAKDIEIEIMYCGVCHSDLHTARNDWGFTVYPAVPGHEIVGKVTKVGSEVTKLKVGDLAGVGCLVDSCHTCDSCKNDLEQYCLTGFTGTYGSADKHLGGYTYGGYSQKIVVDENFVLTVPANLNLAAVAPLLCAGITTWSPLKHWKVGKDSKVAVVGLGGLGHMAVQYAKAMGLNVAAVDVDDSKLDLARRLGATLARRDSSPPEATLRSARGGWPGRSGPCARWRRRQSWPPCSALPERSSRSASCRSKGWRAGRLRGRSRWRW